MSGTRHAQAQLEKAEADVARYVPLAKIHAIPEQDLADAQAAKQVREPQVKQADAEVQVHQTVVSEARLKLSYTSIVSPITGTIVERQVDPGDLVNTDSKTALAVVSTNDPVLVSFSISDADYLKLFAPAHGRNRHDKTPQYQLILADGSTFGRKGSYHAISRTLHQQTDTLTVVPTFPNSDHVLRPGQFAQVRAALEQRMNASGAHHRGAHPARQPKRSAAGQRRTCRPAHHTTASRQDESYVVSGGLQAGEK